MLPHQRLVERGIAIDEHGDEWPLRGNLSVFEADQVYRLVRDTKPEVSIEIGLAHGVSTLAIAQALADNASGTHHVIDPFQRSAWGGAGLVALREAGLDGRIEFHETFPEEVVPGLPRANFAFIDASHLFDLTLLEFVLVDKRLEPNGILGFHDSGMPSVRKALRYVLTNRAYRVRNRPPMSAGSRRKSQISKVVKRVPGAARMFRPELLTTTPDLGVLPNMVFLEKLHDDERHWQDHAEF